MKEARAELVRVDSQGTAHPIGAVASQRLRARTGTYRILPAPRHVVFMRYTGEDGRRDDGDGAVVRLAGEITSPGTLCDVLALLGQTGWRGELVVQDDETRRSIFFEQGSVIGAETNVDAERLGSVLYRFGALTSEQLDFIKQQSDGKRFGETAVQLGLLQENGVYEFMGKQIEEIVFATLMVSDGTFFFLEGFDDSRLAVRRAVSANALLMDGVTRMDELRYFRQKIPSEQHVPGRVEGRGEPAQEFAVVYQLVDGRRSIQEIGRETGLGEFETSKRLYGLVQSNHIVIRPPRPSGGAAAVVATANEALRLAFAAAEAAGKKRELMASLDSFAVGAGVYDILFRGAGPDENGMLRPEVVATNATMVASGSDPESVLKQMLHDYVSFALFSAGGVIEKEDESTLKVRVGPFLAQLRPES